MKRKVLTGLAALAISASFPLTNSVTALADEAQENTESITETAPRQKKQRSEAKAENAMEESPQISTEKSGQQAEADGEKPQRLKKHSRHRRTAAENTEDGQTEMPEGVRKGKHGRKSDEDSISENSQAPEITEDASSGASPRQKESGEEALKEDNSAVALPEATEF